MGTKARNWVIRLFFTNSIGSGRDPRDTKMTRAATRPLQALGWKRSNDDRIGTPFTTSGRQAPNAATTPRSRALAAKVCQHRSLGLYALNRVLCRIDEEPVPLHAGKPRSWRPRTFGQGDGDQGHSQGRAASAIVAADAPFPEFGDDVGKGVRGPRRLLNTT